MRTEIGKLVDDYTIVENCVFQGALYIEPPIMGYYNVGWRRRLKSCWTILRGRQLSVPTGVHVNNCRFYAAKLDPTMAEYDEQGHSVVIEANGLDDEEITYELPN